MEKCLPLSGHYVPSELNPLDSRRKSTPDRFLINNARFKDRDSSGEGSHLEYEITSSRRVRTPFPSDTVFFFRFPEDPHEADTYKRIPPGRELYF